MSQSAESTLPPEEDAQAAEAAVRTAEIRAQIEEFGRIVAEKQEEDALVDRRAAAMRAHERAAFLALPHVVALRAARAWMHAQATSAPPPPSLHGVPRRTPAPRTAARRPAARRSLGARSSQDPGDDADPERPPSRGEPVARVLVRGKDGVFLADECEIAYGVVTASGRWKWRWGPNDSRSRFGPPVARSWPVRRCEVRWASDHGEVSR